MSSSKFTAARVCVMLAFLVIVPAVALLGMPSSERLARLLGTSEPSAVPRTPGGKDYVAAKHTDPWEQAKLEEAPRFEPQAPSISSANGQSSERANITHFQSSPHDLGSYGTSNAGAGPDLIPLPAVSAEPASPLFAEDQFVVIQRRLRQLGAAYYRLEAWTGEGEGYRFVCQLAPVGSPPYTPSFQADDRQPLAAMQKVLAQVEGWHAEARH